MTNLTTEQILYADPEMGYLIDNLPDDVLWRALPNSTEACPMVEVVTLIVVNFTEYQPDGG